MHPRSRCVHTHKRMHTHTALVVRPQNKSHTFSPRAPRQRGGSWLGLPGPHRTFAARARGPRRRIPRGAEALTPAPAPRRRLPLGGFHDGAFDPCRPQVGRVDRTARIRGHRRQPREASDRRGHPSVQLGRDGRTRPRVRWDQGRSSEGVAHEPQSGRESATCATAGPKVPLIGRGHAAAVTARGVAVSTRLRGPREHAAHLRTPRRQGRVSPRHRKLAP